MVGSNPYSGLPKDRFWRSAVSDVSPFDIDGIYNPKFKILKEMRITAAGSCFAQHIARQFKRRGYMFNDVEPAPPFLTPSLAQSYGFDLYSARHGNIYSVRQLLQMYKRAFGRFSPKESVWMSKGRFFDPFRPSIEPDGFASEKELRDDVKYHLNAVATLLQQTDLFVFTFGLTEGWECIADGAVFPSCPGVIAGEFDADKHRFHNFSFEENLKDAEEFIAFATSMNPGIKFLFTVSPVPLTATASGEHVLPATIYSKSVLRAVCGELQRKYANVDYFPSYELVSAYPFRGMFYNPNMRSVNDRGVNHVMEIFFSSHEEKGEEKPRGRARRPNAKRLALAAKSKKADDVMCDDEILEVFG
ncbi:MAG: GSCFA family protein [Hyphomicrobiales bacterium]|nr:MAG: GSCFA family protein [Hyphomicrobiales bacterium]